MRMNSDSFVCDRCDKYCSGNGVVHVFACDKCIEAGQNVNCDDDIRMCDACIHELYSYGVVLNLNDWNFVKAGG